MLCGIVAHRAGLAELLSVSVPGGGACDVCTKRRRPPFGGPGSALTTGCGVTLCPLPPTRSLLRDTLDTRYALRSAVISFQGLVMCTIKLLSDHLPLG